MADYYFDDSAHSAAFERATKHERRVWLVFQAQGAEADHGYDLLEQDAVPAAPGGDPTAIKGYYAPDGEWHPYLLTTSDAADALGVTPARIRQMVLAGELPAQKLGRDVFISGVNVERARHRKTKPGPTPR